MYQSGENPKGTCIISANGTLPSMVIRRLEG